MIGRVLEAFTEWVDIRTPNVTGLYITPVGYYRPNMMYVCIEWKEHDINEVGRDFREVDKICKDNGWIVVEYEDRQQSVGGTVLKRTHFNGEPIYECEIVIKCQIKDSEE